jgi:hypothetical protein
VADHGGLVRPSDTGAAQPGTAAERVVSVSSSGNSGSYSFNVTLQTADKGCDHYADWWEVVTADGALLYRRILAHSHVEEQPFTRSGGPVEVAAADVVRVRLHMNTTGYSSMGMEGSVAAGFAAADFGEGFAPDVGGDLPSGCAF